MSRAKYLLRVGPIVYGNEHPAECTVSQSYINCNRDIVFEYCYSQLSETLKDVSTFLKIFDISTVHGEQYIKAVCKAKEEGTSISMCTDDYNENAISIKHHVGKDQILISYCEVILLCFATEGSSEKLFIHVPNSAPMERCVTVSELEGLARVHTLDQDSWGVIGKQSRLPMQELSEIKKQMTPKSVNLRLQDGWYKIFNKKCSGPLFCGDGVDSGGDHWAQIEPRRSYENNGKELMRLEYQSDGTYKIFNKKWEGPLFCGDDKDLEGDHRAWFEPRATYENNGKERWSIEEQKDGTYKIFNKKWGGPLFCGDGVDSGGDYWAWVESSIDYENKGKERWEFERVQHSF